MSDDSGISIDALGGAPGILSARYMGEDTPYTVKNAAIIEKLSGKEGAERGAHYTCVIAMILPDGREFTAEGKMFGEIAKAPAGENGFGYDPIFFLPEYGKTTGELPKEVKNSITHRHIALEQAKAILKKELFS